MPNDAEPRRDQAPAWYATHHHPRGADVAASFEVVGSMVYPVGEHVGGDAGRPWYQVRDGFAYPVDGHPHGTSTEPAFRVADGRVYPASMDVVAPDVPAWFEIRPGS